MYHTFPNTASRHTMSHHHTYYVYYVTSSYILCHIIIHTMSHHTYPNTASRHLFLIFISFCFKKKKLFQNCVNLFLKNRRLARCRRLRYGHRDKNCILIPPRCGSCLFFFAIFFAKKKTIQRLAFYVLYNYEIFCAYYMR